MDLLKKLSEIAGVPGREERVRLLIEEEVRDHVDAMRVDAMGNLLCYKKGSGPRVMVACHMDEIGFIVRYVDDKGFLRVQQLGGFDTRNLFARRVRVATRQGGDLIGNLNPGGKPIHVATAEDRKKVPLVGEFYVDLGLSAERAKELVRPGDPVSLEADFIEMSENLASGKSLDNRVACWLGVRLLQQAADLSCDLHVAFTVQEEIGLRGAQTAAYQIEPEIAVALDVTLAVDTPGIGEEDHITKLGGGCAIKVMDAGTVSDHELVQEFIDLAERHEIPYQLEVLPFGATDNAAQQRSRSGARAIALSVPTRYVHTITETLDKRDLYAALELLKRYVSAPR